MRFGVHIWVGQGLKAAASHAVALKCESLQLFVRNPRGWGKGATWKEEAISYFNRTLARHKVHPIFVHAAYLVNLASPNEALRRRSLEAVISDMNRGMKLGARCLVVHCGHATDGDGAAGRRRLVRAVRSILGSTDRSQTILLENMAGAANDVAVIWEEIAEILEGIGDKRAGACFDTCHAHAAGYDLSSPAGLEAALRSFDRMIGLKRLSLIHANDSRLPAGSRRDLHEHIGRGTIGIEGFRALVNHPRLQALPVILETPIRRPGDDRRNLRLLRSLVETDAEKGKQ